MGFNVFRPWVLNSAHRRFSRFISFSLPTQKPKDGPRNYSKSSKSSITELQFSSKVTPTSKFEVTAAETAKISHNVSAHVSCNYGTKSNARPSRIDPQLEAPSSSKRGNVCRTIAKSNSAPKPFQEVPCSSDRPFSLMTLLRMAWYSARLNDWFLHNFHSLGPVWRLRAGHFDLVNVMDPHSVEAVYRQEGRYPQRNRLPLWEHFRHQEDESFGVFLMTGKDWKRTRQVLNKPLLRQGGVEFHVSELNRVVTQFLQALSSHTTHTGLVTGLQDLLFLWSLESVGHVLYEKELGCFRQPFDRQAWDFIHSLHDVFDTNNALIALPPALARVIHPLQWRRHMNGWKVCFRIARHAIDEKMSKLKRTDQRQTAPDGLKGLKATAEDKGLESTADNEGFLAYLLSQSHVLSQKEVIGNVSDMMMAAVDTTSNTAQMLLYELAHNAQAQSLARKEVASLVEEGQQPGSQHVKRMTYLKACLKETLRLYPTIQYLFRVLPEDCVLHGYTIPAGTTMFMHLLSMGRQEELFAAPLSFRPERWLRDRSELQSIHPFASIPFGFGPRMCIGRRLAELELQLLVSQVLLKYDLEPADDKPLEFKTAGATLCTTKSVQLRFIPRN